MCLIAFAWKTHPDYALVLAANRDEFHQRPAAPAAFWKDRPDVFGGRDLSQGGSWLALNRNGRLACVTNVRRMVPPNPAAPSRGRLVTDFVQGSASAADFATALESHVGVYASFNLLLFDGGEACYVGHLPEFKLQPIKSGVHGLSNATLDTPWPKLSRLKAAMQGFSVLRSTDPEILLDALADRKPAADDALPNTGIDLEKERLLSSPFIVSEQYGTRCSSVVTIRHDGAVDFIERRFAADGSPAGESRERFGLKI